MDADLTPVQRKDQLTAAPDEEAAGAPGKTLRRINLWPFALPLCFVLGLVIGYVLFALPLRGEVADLRGQLDAAQSAYANQVEVPQDIKRYDVPIDDDPVFGPEDAPITIIEFSDYECPYCKKWHLETWPLIKQNYGDKVRLVYRDFPLIGLHPNAIPAAEAANCAGDQGQYWEFNDALFIQDMNLGREVYENTASDLGLNLDVFRQCLDDRPHQAEVEADYDYAANLGVSSTPTFFINGIALIGAQPYEVFAQVIDLELAGEIPQ